MAGGRPFTPQEKANSVAQSIPWDLGAAQADTPTTPPTRGAGGGGGGGNSSRGGGSRGSGGGSRGGDGGAAGGIGIFESLFAGEAAKALSAQHNKR